VREAAGQEARISVLKFESGRWFSCDIVLNLGGTNRDKNVVVIVAVHLNLIIGHEFNLENTNVLILENDMMMGLSRDVDCRGLGESEDRGKQDNGEKGAFHGMNSSRRYLALGSGLWEHN
jgi:hypothetical protein